MNRYPADSALIRSRLRGTHRMIALAVLFIVAAVVVVIAFLATDRLAWSTAIITALLVIVSVILLLRVRSTRKKLTSSIGSEYIVDREGLTSF